LQSNLYILKHVEEKDKVVPVHTMKACKGSRGTAAVIYNLDARLG